MLVSRRYERASLIVTSNKPFSAWGEIFGYDMAAVAMVDRLIHHAELCRVPSCAARRRWPGEHVQPRAGPLSARPARRGHLNHRTNRQEFVVVISRIHAIRSLL